MTRSRLLQLCLLLSVAVNLLVGGAILTRIVQGPDEGFRPLPPNVGWLVRDMDDARRAEFAPLLEASSAEARPLREEMFQAQRRLNQLMAEPELNLPAIAEAFNKLRDANGRYQELSHQHTIDIVSKMSEAERKAAFEFLNRRVGPRDGPRNGREGRDGRPDDGSPPPDGARPPGPPR